MTEMSPAEAIFFAAAAKEVADRSAYLVEACAGDAELRQRVERMLAARPHADRFLEPRAAASGNADGSNANRTAGFSGKDEHLGAILAGKYKLIEEIGEGGMGSVYMAQQTEPVKRAVAVKVIKAGMDSKAVLARFEAERQALAMMDHPNIARVLDAGTTESGRPFFVMELVKGLPITQYCDERKLTPRQRLELFVPVCEAIQHAHHKGIIHRDIKPSNVLIAMYDDRAVPKVIDFGVAKATGQALTDKTLMTGFGAIVGTAEYMSPEQANLNNQDIDTRSDVYSLGVLLYELLTGSTPVDRKSLDKAALLEILRIVREVEAPKPSTRLSATGTLTSVAANRGTEPAKLSKLLKSELDCVVMKALEKDRQRRYETANGLAMDIQRYLSGEAVMAAPPSTAYRFKKFIRRNRVLVTAGSAVAAALLIGVVAFAWQAQVARDQRDIAVKAQQAEAEQRKAAEAARGQAEKIAEFLSEMLHGAAPIVALGRDTTMLKEMMDAAAERIEKGEFKSAPEAELRLRGTIGSAYIDLAAYDAAARMLEPAVALARSIYPGDHLATADAIGNMVHLLHVRHEAAKAEPLAREVLEMTRRLLPGDHMKVATALHDLAMMYRALGQQTKAEPLMREALEMNRRLSPGDLDDLADCITNLAGIRQSSGENAEAEPLCREALEMYRRLHPADHPHVAYGAHNLASVLEDRGDLAGAVPLYREAAEICQRIYMRDHPLVGYRILNLVRVLVARGDQAGAEQVLLQHCQKLVERNAVSPLKINERIRETFERLVQLYETMDKKDEAARWRKELETIKAAQKPETKP